MTALAEALALAGPQNYLRVFVDEGRPMAALLGRLIAAQRANRAAAEVPLGYLARFSVPSTPRLPSLTPVKTVRLGCTAWWTR